MNPDLLRLQPYPFEKLASLKQGTCPPANLEHIALSIGEPKHEAPQLALETLHGALGDINRYPLTKGSSNLRGAIAAWLQRRFSLPAGSLDPEQQIIPVNGSREALFSFAQAIVDRSKSALVLMPNPFYQIYEGAALLAGAQPWFYSTDRHHNYQPDFEAIPDEIWQRCQLLYICSPGNPTGAVLPLHTLKSLIAKAEQFDFIIASDECYSEIYFDEDQPPPGLLQAAAEMGNHDYKRCVVFNSLSKRSNLPGMRSGLVAGDAEIIKSYLLYRTYHGSAMPPAHQAASAAIWGDETHVMENRRRYRHKFDQVLEILRPALDASLPDAGFYLWLPTPITDTDFARELFAQQHVTVLPGRYLSRKVGDFDPGEKHIRIALVASEEECIKAAERISAFVESLN